MNSETITNKAIEELLTNIRPILDHLPRITVSRCLMGDWVRYDGSHKSLEHRRSPLARYLELKAFCPEISAGMGVPREPIQWVESDTGELQLQQVNAPQLRFEQTLRDTCEDWLSSQPRLEAGILKARSPSCGSGNTPIYSTAGEKLRDADGQWTSSLKQAHPDIWLINEEQCTNLETIYRFITALYLQQLQRQTLTPDLSSELKALAPQALLSQNTIDNLRVYHHLKAWLTINNFETQKRPE
jgi:uncharacterized protein YbbK (DUF523 family)